MNKNERIEIKPIMNGYIVSYEYRAMTNPTAADKYDRWEHTDEESMFSTWDEVVAYIASKKLETPPVKLN